uniref:Uncharacterized protein n=1 Tax=Sphaerodactylus townsendi TaxID=933632 RepID=A0ACB8EJ68_9SAUR
MMVLSDTHISAIPHCATSPPGTIPAVLELATRPGALLPPVAKDGTTPAVPDVVMLQKASRRVPAVADDVHAGKVGIYRPLTFCVAILEAFYQSLICFFVPYLVYYDSDIGVFTFGTIINTVSLFTILFHQALEFKTWTLFHWITIIGSILLYFIFSTIYNAACIICNHPTNPYWIMEMQFSNPNFYLICLITPTVALLPRYFILAVQGTLQVSPILKAQYLDKLPKEQQDQEIRKWKSRRQATSPGATVPSDELSQPTANVSLSIFDHEGGGMALSGNGGHQNLCPPEQDVIGKWMPDAESSDQAKRWTEEEAGGASFFSTEASLGQSLASKPFSGFLPSNAESSVRRSHRRSVSAVTL